MNKQYEKEFKKFLGCLKDSGYLNNIIVIGSWAEYLYKESGLIEGFYPSMQTIDVDFEGILDIVPEPEAYILQKMIINDRRGLKAEKDREKIKELLNFINENRLSEIKKH